MAYSEQVLHRAARGWSRPRRSASRRTPPTERTPMPAIPRLAEIDNELRRTMAELMAAALQRGEDPSQAVAAVRGKKNLALQRERSWILEAGDFDDGYLTTRPCAPVRRARYIGAQMLVPARAVPAGAEKRS